jgi:SanA protein
MLRRLRLPTLSPAPLRPLRPKRGHSWWKAAWLCIWLLLALTLILIVVSNQMVLRAAQSRLYDSVSEIPARKVGLVLGTSPTSQGQPNVYYEARLNAAAALYKAGRVEDLILSGDNSTTSYDEPTRMKADLVARGLPAGHLFLDYAGFRTLDSVVRARDIFGLTAVTIISQRFHNERAVFLAQNKGIDAIAYNAEDVEGAAGLRTRGREWLARTSAVLDVKLLGTQPKFLGVRVQIP